MRTSLTRVILIVALAALSAGAQPVRRRCALLIGINDYTAAHPGPGAVPNRDYSNLTGAAPDARLLQEMLVLLYHFEKRDIVTLIDQAATRSAIFEALEELIKNAQKDDVILFYYAGHGSQVKNSLSDERDLLDESIVPADSRSGAPDIRDKELRPLFNRILDRGARLTVILDNCHSGSGARGLGTGARPRGVSADPRDVADRSTSPAPESRGALVLSAAQDSDSAWETRDRDGKFHGVFTWAWIRSMRDSSANEPALDTFLRTQARMRAETPYQDPVLAGNTEAKLTPFLGTRDEHRDAHTVAAVTKVQSDGTVILQGGWANGLTVGTELQLPGTATRLTISAMRGVGECEARVERADAPISAGMLFEVSAWAALPTQPLRVWIPRLDASFKDIAEFGRQIANEAAPNVRLVPDPTEARVGHLLRRGVHDWELIGPAGEIEPLPSEDAAMAAVARIPHGSSLFLQLPVPAKTADALGIERLGVVMASGPEDADYILVGRYSGRGFSYAWLRPSVKKADRRTTGLPLRTRWIKESRAGDALRNTPVLRDLLQHLRTIHSWNQLESPPGSPFPYRLAVRRKKDGELARESGVIGNERYEIVLQAAMPLPAKIAPRYIYAFTVDSNGKSTLLFPFITSGSVENRFPPSPPPAEIELGDASSFEVGPPYGVDTYFLLTTDEPLPNPAILEWDGVRSGGHPETPLEQLLAMTASGTRSSSIATPASWSIEKVVYESIGPRATSRRK
jgi:Caspase domain